MTDKDIYSAPESDLGSPDVSIDPNLASRWARFFATLVDSLVLVVPFAALMYDSEYWQRAMNQQVTLQETLISYLLGLLLYLVVNGYLLARRGQSIGKYALGIRIVSYDTNALLPLWKLITLRYLPQTGVANIPLFGQWLSIINVLFIFRKDKRCVHDFIAGTKVIKE